MSNSAFALLRRDLNGGAMSRSATGEPGSAMLIFQTSE